MGYMKTIWSKGDFMLSEDAQTWKEIESAEQECVPFSLAFRESGVTENQRTFMTVQLYA